MGHSRQASANTFLLVSYSRSVMIVLRRSLYGVVSDGRFMGLFVPLPPAVLTGFPQGPTFRWKRVLAELSFSVLCSSSFTHGTSTLIPVHLPLGRRDYKGFPLTLCFLVLRAGPSQAPTLNVESGSPVKRLLFAGGVFLDALLYYQ